MVWAIFVRRWGNEGFVAVTNITLRQRFARTTPTRSGCLGGRVRHHLKSFRQRFALSSVRPQDPPAHAFSPNPTYALNAFGGFSSSPPVLYPLLLLSVEMLPQARCSGVSYICAGRATSGASWCGDHAACSDESCPRVREARGRA